jgi:uncharacterized protein involved in outer membrane biogenesis
LQQIHIAHTLTRWETLELAEPLLPLIVDEDSAAIASADVAVGRPSKRGLWKRPIQWLLLLVIALWAADTGISLLIHHTVLQKKLTARLSAAFGRPVEVGRYEVSIWTGPTLEAQSVTVSEDPRFGQEYFLRAESLRVRPRWRSLLRGHLELGGLLLTQPSLNIVRNTEGDWNLAEWLPRPASRGAAGPPLPASTLRFERIEIEGGRVNFKRADEKLPFAFVEVRGTVQADGPGRWQMNIAASPWRASIVTQQAGSIYVAGHVGGTSSRLLPAVLDFSWTGASISDALRLIGGDDYGVRGALAVALSARAGDDGWKLQARAQMRQLHRWDLSLRPDNPALNLTAQMKIGANASQLELTEAKLEAPRSNAHASGQILWNDVERSPKSAPSPLTLKLSDLNVDANDILAWVRAFHSGVADTVAIKGGASASAVIVGWPPRIDSATFLTDGADLRGPGLRVPVHLAKTEIDYALDQVSLSPVKISFPPPAGPSSGAFRLDKSTKTRSKAAAWRLVGSMEQVRDLIAAAGSLGWNLSRGWDLAGPFQCDVRWQEPQLPWSVPSAGTIELGGTDGTDGASLRSAFLNRPIEQIKVRADWKPGVRHVSLSSAQVFGARWSGSFDRRDNDDRWQFVLSADHLAASDVDRWLNPRWRESFIDRMLPFLNTRAAADAVPENLRASGRLSVDQLTLAPVTVRHLQGDAALDGRHFEFTGASGQFYGGTVSGMFITDMKAVPSYQVNADFAKVDLSALSAASPGTADLFDGTATGQIFFTAHGASRSDIVSSLQCRGSADVDAPRLQSINLADSLRDVAIRPGTSLFHDASAAFTCANGKIQFHDFALIDPAEEIDGAGSVDFSRILDFRLSVVHDSALSEQSPGTQEDTPASTPGAVSYELSGPLSSPQLTRISSSPHRAR